MFGTYRYLLANMVVIAHLWPQLAYWVGMYAVFSFYALSGYLMALVLTRTYAYDVHGTAHFLLNRALRIYPPYLVVLIGSILVVWANPELARALNGHLQLPGSLTSWLHNIVIFGQSGDWLLGTSMDEQRLVPPAWSLDVELTFYVGMGLLLARRRSVVWVWFCLSLAYTVYIVAAGYDLQARYYPVGAASLPFSLGALIFHHRAALSRIAGWHVWLGAGLFVIHSVIAGRTWNDPVLQGLYVSLLLAAYTMIGLANVPAKSFPSWLKTLDQQLGDLSYPIFLCHWPVACFVAWAFLGRAAERGPQLFFISFVAANIVAILIHQLVEKRISKVRDQVRRT